MSESQLPDPLANHPKYTRVRALGQGAFGTVQLAKERSTNKEVAIKFLQLDATFDKRYVQNEILNHRLLVHPHIVEFKEVFVTKHHLGIVMEWCSGGNLYEYVKKRGVLHEFEARWFFQQLTLALDYCHRRIGVVNRDLKLENLLLKSCSTFPVLKVCDFGYSKHLLQNSAPISRVGSPAYVAPEVLWMSERGAAYDGEKADIWSAGVVLYVMLSGRYPFTKGKDMAFCLKAIRELTQQGVQEAIGQLTHISVPCKQLLSKILVVNPAQRVALPEILKDGWFCQMLPDLSKMRYCANVTSQSAEEIQQILNQAQVTAQSYCHSLVDDMDDNYSDEEHHML